MSEPRTSMRLTKEDRELINKVMADMLNDPSIRWDKYGNGLPTIINVLRISLQHEAQRRGLAQAQQGQETGK